MAATAAIVTANSASNATLPTAAPREVGLSAGHLSRISDVFRAEVDRGLVPGAVMLVARRGRVAWFDAQGTLAPGGGVPMSRDAIFRIYSMTKPIVSVATMMLFEEGRLQLTDPVSSFVPEFANQSVAIERDGQVQLVPVQTAATLQDLLRHTSGLAYEFTGTTAVQRRYVDEHVGSRRRDNAAFAAHLAGLPLMHQPGTRWEYSRATDVLGRIIEVVSGRKLGEFLAERIFGPLGMVDSGFSVPSSQHHRLAEAFERDPDTGEAVRLYDVRHPPTFESGGGGLASTAADYARFAQMLLQGGTMDGERYLGRKTLEWMTADHLGSIPSNSPILPAGYGFGLGFAVRLADGIAAIPGSAGHYFWEGLAGTTFWVDPKEQLVAVLMIQAPGRRDHFRNLFRGLVYASIED